MVSSSLCAYEPAGAPGASASGVAPSVILLWAVAATVATARIESVNAKYDAREMTVLRNETVLLVTGQTPLKVQPTASQHSAGKSHRVFRASDELDKRAGPLVISFQLDEKVVHCLNDQ